MLMHNVSVKESRTSRDDSDASEPLYVARPIMPPLDELMKLLEGIWSTRIVTNEGPLHNRLEAELSALLRVPVAKLFNNGTSGLQAALLALDLPQGSEVITTPLTFAATAHSITATGLRPVFADISEDTLTLDPTSVERAITPKTKAVLAVHVYGTLCDHAGLSAVCQAQGLKLIYDAAHAFASDHFGLSTAAMGDLSVFSLHANKLYNTFEGGIVTATDEGMAERLRLVRNFGIANENEVRLVGINGKMSELNAAIGLLNLGLFETERALRSQLRSDYDEIIAEIPGIRPQIRQEGVSQSEQYYAILVDPASGTTRDEIYDALKLRNIFARKYFMPICTDFDCYKGEPIYTAAASAVADKVKDRVLCLPFHSGVQPYHVDIIASTLKDLVRR